MTDIAFFIQTPQYTCVAHRDDAPTKGKKYILNPITVCNKMLYNEYKVKAK